MHLNSVVYGNLYQYGVLGKANDLTLYVHLCLEAFLINEIKLIHLKCKGYRPVCVTSNLILLKIICQIFNLYILPLYGFSAPNNTCHFLSTCTGKHQHATPLNLIYENVLVHNVHIFGKSSITHCNCSLGVWMINKLTIRSAWNQDMTCIATAI